MPQAGYDGLLMLANQSLKDFYITELQSQSFCRRYETTGGFIGS
jgi:hypothetical protein